MSSKIEVSDDAGARARRVWRIDYAGSIGDLKLKTESISKPKSGEIQVQICYCGLNFADIAAVQGLYSATPKGSFIPGLEYSGIVVDVGSDVSFFHIGDQVFGCTKFGGYAEYINIDPCYVRHVPPGWSLKEASAFCCQALTAWYGLVDLGRLKLKSNASDVVKPFAVLIHSGAGGVGLFAGELVLAAGGSPIFTVGDSSKAEFLMSRFASQIKREQIIVRSNSKDFAFDLKTAMTSVGVDSLRIVFDSLLQRASFEASMKVLDKGGYCVIYGAGSMMTGPRDSPNWITLAWRYLWRPKIDPLQLISENKNICCFNLIWLYDESDKLGLLVDDMLRLMKWMKPHVGHMYSFEEAPTALRFFQKGTNIGKIVLEVSKNNQ